MVSSLLAGIKPLLAVDRGGLLPESLTRKKNAANLSTGGRLQIGMVAGFKSEYPAGLNRDPQQNRAADESLYFHELIHVVQWRLLGPEHFLSMYADGLERFGYRDSPLEKMAYGAQASFNLSSDVFDAEKL